MREGGGGKVKLIDALNTEHFVANNPKENKKIKFYAPAAQVAVTLESLINLLYKIVVILVGWIRPSYKHKRWTAPCFSACACWQQPDPRAGRKGGRGEKEEGGGEGKGRTLAARSTLCRGRAWASVCLWSSAALLFHLVLWVIPGTIPTASECPVRTLQRLAGGRRRGEDVCTPNFHGHAQGEAASVRRRVGFPVNSRCGVAQRVRGVGAKAVEIVPFRRSKVALFLT